MTDTIVYTTVSLGGGVDGRDHTDKGGNVTGAYLDKGKAQNSPNKGWEKVVPIVVDLEETATNFFKKADPVLRLAIEHHYNGTATQTRIGLIPRV
jgi:flagellar basal body-associated protein FliL